MYCPNCGTQLADGSGFCSHCGTPIRMQTAEPAYAGPLTNQQRWSMEPLSLVGFSERCHHPEILSAAKKNRRSAIVFMWILVLAALIGFPIAGLLMEDFPLGEAIIVSIFVSLVMLTFGLFFLSSSKKPIWEGTVTNKYSKKKSEHRDDTSNYYTEYTVRIVTDRGQKKKIVERDSRRHMYDYLAVGDRVRYHPRFQTFEKYDKSRDNIIYCNVCSMMNQIHSDRCKRCKNLLFK